MGFPTHSGWWCFKHFLFLPQINWGFMIQFDEHILTKWVENYQLALFLSFSCWGFFQKPMLYFCLPEKAVMDFVLLGCRGCRF